ncbi:MAG: Gfo/Idh/MocA family oxidoreductase [Clostridia bacterium]|nr:Gfo/Idh/MocA family oxidoreductase [Clostridia bacterium]
MEKVRVALIGLGERGQQYLYDELLCHMDDVEITVICDVYEDRMKASVGYILDKNRPAPKCEADYKKAIDDPDVDVVLITTSWESHVDIAVYAMKAGKITAMEVGGAYDIEDCWRLVRTYEETGTPFMFLENCCYGRLELMALNMAQQGMFGEIVHCAGAYHHNLAGQVCNGRKNRHYRQRNYVLRNTENYPTHELGPIAKILNINHGNRMLSLTATASKEAGMREYINTVSKEKMDEGLENVRFAQGDVVTTVIKCAGGETITLMLDTSIVNLGGRSFTIRGTKGLVDEQFKCVSCEHNGYNRSYNNLEEYFPKYDHPMWKEFLDSGITGGHGGMDWLEFRDFFECVKAGKPMPIDVYDAAAWMAVTALAEQSIALGSAPVFFPDFTRGKWTLDAATEK